MKPLLRFVPFPMILVLILGLPAATEPNPMEEPVPPTTEAPAKPAVPAIDAAAPSKFETATFALG